MGFSFRVGSCFNPQANAKQAQHVSGRLGWSEDHLLCHEGGFKLTVSMLDALVSTANFNQVGIIRLDGLGITAALGSELAVGMRLLRRGFILIDMRKVGSFSVGLCFRLAGGLLFDLVRGFLSCNVGALTLGFTDADFVLGVGGAMLAVID